MTQGEGAAALGYTRNWLSQVEQGHNSIDAIDLMHLANVYHQPLGYFLEAKYDVRTASLPRSRVEWERLYALDPGRGRAHHELDQLFDRSAPGRDEKGKSIFG